MGVSFSLSLSTDSDVSFRGNIRLTNRSRTRTARAPAATVTPGIEPRTPAPDLSRRRCTSYLAHSPFAAEVGAPAAPGCCALPLHLLTTGAADSTLTAADAEVLDGIYRISLCRPVRRTPGYVARTAKSAQPIRHTGWIRDFGYALHCFSQVTVTGRHAGALYAVDYTCGSVSGTGRRWLARPLSAHPYRQRGTDFPCTNAQA